MSIPRIVALLLPLAGCSAMPTTESECTGEEKVWVSNFCRTKTSDAGKPCRSGRDCESECWIKYDWFREGQCYPFTDIGPGCPLYILVDEGDLYADRAVDHPDGGPDWPKVAGFCID